jgi:RNA polymerase sigma-32 factor
MLERQEEYLLAKRWREHGDRDAAHKLVTSHLRLVTKIARDYRGYGLPISEADSFVDWIVAQPESERDASTRPRLGHEFNSVYQSSRPLN